ncbi:MAG: hypothetical protein SPL73_03095 [Cyanobacteriota bacterium]|nr:hypothetical protein [Cyanobacteriota bacterium]MDY6383561.1 hypothetical protein [Cyanobacteriota bacterium]
MNFYVGLSLASSSGMDSGVAVIDENNNIITLDKLYKMNDVIHFFENFTSLKDSCICASIPLDRTMLEGKWRIFGKQYQSVATNKIIPNRDNWTQRLSTRGCEYFRELTMRGIPVTRFDIYMTRQSIHLNSCYKDRSPADCKFLQQALKYEWGFEDLGSNMLPMSHLEAIIGAILAKENNVHPEKLRALFDFKGLKVLDLKENIMTSSDVFQFEQELSGVSV